MRIDSLYYFVKTADHRSFSSASEELFLSQQALSASIKKLEKEFNVVLFTRTPKGVILTEDGKVFYDTARQMLSLYEKLYNHFLRQPEINEKMKIALSPQIKDYYFPKIISYFLREYPQCQIDYLTIDHDEIVSSLKTGKADLAVLPRLMIKDQFIDHLWQARFIPLITSRLSLLTSIHSPIADFKTISMTSVLQHPLIINGSKNAPNHLYFQLLEHYHHRNVITVDGNRLQLQMVEDGLGNMFYPQHSEIPSKKYVKIPITDHFFINTGFLLPKKPLTSFQLLYLEKAKNIITKNF